MTTKKTVSTVIQLILFSGLAILLIVWQMNRMDATQKEAMYQAILSANIWYSVPVAIVGFLSHYFRALRWRLLLEPLAIKPSKANTFFAVMIGYLVNTVLPRFGEVAKCTVLAKYEKVPADKMVGTIVAERAFDLVCLVVIMFLVLVLQVGVIGGYAKDLYMQMQSQKGHSLIWIGVALLLFLAITPFLYKKIKKTKVGGILKGIGDGVRSILMLRNRGLFFIYTIGIWASYLGMVVLGFKCMPATAHLGALEGLTVLAFGSISMIITPGGIGSYPPIVASILELYGIALPAGTAFGWVAWSAQTVVIILFGLFSLLLLPIFNRSKNA